MGIFLSLSLCCGIRRGQRAVIKLCLHPSSPSHQLEGFSSRVPQINRPPPSSHLVQMMLPLLWNTTDTFWSDKGHNVWQFELWDFLNFMMLTWYDHSSHFLTTSYSPFPHFYHQTEEQLCISRSSTSCLIHLGLGLRAAPVQLHLKQAVTALFAVSSTLLLLLLVQ